MGHASSMWDMTHCTDLQEDLEVWVLCRLRASLRESAYGTWLIHMGYDSSMCDMTSYGTCHHCLCKMWLVHMGHDAFIWDTTHSWDLTLSLVTWHHMGQAFTAFTHGRRDSFIWDSTHTYGTWQIHLGHDTSLWDQPHSYGTRVIPTRWGSSIQDLTYLCGTWYIHVGRDTFMFSIPNSYGTWVIHMRRDSFMRRAEEVSSKSCCSVLQCVAVCCSVL